jgi:choline dehydrogenase-like flavoprotein
VTLQTHAEQAPNPDSRVTLSRRRDRLGVPLPKVDWRLTSLDRRTAEVMVHTVAEEFRRLGLGEVRPQPWLADPRWIRHASDSFHHMGTTRLGSDPTTGVVDPNCQIHGVRGLFVAGASVFPAAGFANPTLTIAALAIRLADHLKATVDRPPTIFSSLS